MKRAHLRRLRDAAKTARRRHSARQPRPLGVSLARFTSAFAMLGALVAGTAPAKAATYYWDGDQNSAGNDASTGLGLGNGPGSNLWDLMTPSWWNGLVGASSDIPWPNSLFDTAFFTGTAGTVTLGAPINVGSLIFNQTGYNIAGNGNTLTFGGPISVLGTGSRATISAQMPGTGGLMKLGDGALVLSNVTNNFTGDVVINGGSVVITDAAQLGTGTTAISIGGLAGTGNPGFSGGQLVLNGGGTGPGLTISREISVSGRGPGAINNSGGVVSVGYNTLAGHLTLGGPNGLGDIVATHGITTITGNVLIGNTGNSSTFFGNGNYIVSGRVSGFDLSADRFAKSGQSVASTLWLQNSTNDFAETMRIDTGTVRVSNAGALGVNNGIQAVDFNGGLLEVRTDTDGATFASRNINQRANSTIFVDRAVGGSAINQLVTFGNLNVSTSNTNISILGRDGTQTSIGTGTTIAIATGNPWTLNYDNSGTASLNGAGKLTLNHSLSFNDGTGRVMTLASRGDMVLTGNILSPSGGNHIWNKIDTGTLTIQGTAGTFTGSFGITGTAVVTSIAALNTTATGIGAIQLNAGALDYRGTGETRSKLLNLIGSTGQGIIYANQPSGTGLVFNGPIVGAGGAGTKIFYLGGSSDSSIINEIGGLVSNNSGTNTTSLSKIGGNTWLYDPAAAGYTAGTTQATVAAASGTNTNVITLGAANPGIFVGQTVTGTNVPSGSVVTSISGVNLTISNNISTAIGATGAAATLTFGATTNFTGNVTVSGGVLQVRPTATGVASGSDVINNTSQVIFAADALTNTQWAGGTFEYQGSTAGGTLTEQVGALTPTAGHGIVLTTANGGTPTLNFASLGTRTAGATLNLQPTGGPITFTAAAGANGILGGYATFGLTGTEFAAAVTAGGSASALTGQLPLPTSASTATVNYQSTATPSGNIAAESINSLKMSGAQTITLGGILTLTSGGILFDNSTGAATIAGTAAANTLGASASEVIVTTNGTSPGNLLAVTPTTGNALTVSAVISGGAGSLTKAGSGVLILSGANAYTGTTTINEGGIQLSGSSTLGGTNAGLMMRQGTVLDLNGVSVGTLTANGLNAFNGAGTITNNAASGTAVFRFGNGNSGGIWNGLIQDGANAKISVSKGGTATMEVTTAQTYTGATRLAGGNFDVAVLSDIGQASGIGRGDATNNAGSLIFAGGSLRYLGTNSGEAVLATATPSISINRQFTLEGSGGIYSYGSFGNTVATRNANNAALVFNSTADVTFLGTGTRTLTLGGDSAGDNELRIRLTDNTNGGAALSLTKADSGLWILNPATASIYTGATTITAGQLQATDGQGLSSGSSLRIGGGVFQSAGIFNRTVGTGGGQVAFTDAAGTSLTQSGGFAASSAKLTVNLGAQTWGNSTVGFLGTGTLVLSSLTALADVEYTGGIDLNGGTAASVNITNANASNAITLTTGTTVGLVLGQILAGPNIPVGSVITSITSATQFTISNNASAANTAAAANTTLVASGTPASLTVTTVASSPTLTVTAGSTAGILPGQPITGTNIPANAYVLSVTGTTITLNQNAATGAAGNPVTATPVVGRTIQVDDNTSTGLDFATASGVLSGSGGLSKTGAGNLILGDANTYSGATLLNQGALYVTSVGAAGATSSSLGTNVSGGALLIGNTSNTGGLLLYVGPGETATRPVILNHASLTTNTVADTIDSSGSGALVLAALSNNAIASTGILTISLRGTNTDGNMITSVIANPAGVTTGSTVVTKSDGGVWILNPTTPNTFTGAINANAGLLGLTASGIGSAASVTISNGGIFAFGGDLITGSTLNLANNATAVFAGQNNITFTGAFNKVAGVNDQTISNNLENGRC